MITILSIMITNEKHINKTNMDEEESFPISLNTIFSTSEQFKKDHHDIIKTSISTFHKDPCPKQTAN